MGRDKIEAIARELRKELGGDWWNDHRRNWCAYCGIPMRRRAEADGSQPKTLKTKDHVIPKAHKAGRVTIPACRSCNVAKGTMSLQEFLQTGHYKASRLKKHKNKWTVAELWAVSALAALRHACDLHPASAAAKPIPASPQPSVR